MIKRLKKTLARRVVPHMTEGVGKAVSFARVETRCGSSLDIVIADIVVRVGSDFDPEHLVRVLRAVRKA